MEFLVFGATGRTGRVFVRLALAAGHRVSALVRDQTEGSPDGIDVTFGDVLDAARVSAVVRPEQTIVITLGGVEPLTVGCAHIIAAAQAVGATRLLGVVGAGVLQADATRQRRELPDYPAMFRQIGAGHQALYAAVSSSSLDWTLVCTPRILDGSRSTSVDHKADYLPDGRGSVTTEDVAGFLLDEAIARRFVRMRVGINATG